MTKYYHYYLPIGLAFTLVAAGAAMGAWYLSLGKALPDQPIAFNHKLHLERVQGIACADCHQFVMSETYAGIPSKNVCFDCHDIDAQAEADESPELTILRSFGDHDDDIPWHRVTSMRDDVFFSHRRHVAVAGLDCRQCHPQMPDRTSPPSRGPMRMSMAECIDCHEQDDVSVDCVACHI